MRRVPVNNRVEMLFERAYNPDPRVQRVSGALARAGFDVRILAWDRTGSLPAVDKEGNVRIIRVGPRSSDGRGLLQLLYLAGAVLRFIPHLRKRRPGIIHAIDLPMLAAALFISPLIGRPVIVYDAFEIYAIMESRKYPRPVIQLIAAFEKALPRFADLMLVAGENRQVYFARRGITSTVVGNWIDAPAQMPSRDEARKQLGISPERLTILYAGGLDPSRDLASLLQHAERVPEDLVLIAGRGVQEAAVADVAERLENVRFLGFLTDPTAVTAAADILYYSLLSDHPYAEYAAPNNLYVALAFAKPLIHRRQGEIGVLAERADIGEAFTDEASLDRAIDLLRDEERRRRIAGNMAELGRDYSWTRAGRILEAAYPRPQTMINRPRTNGP